MAFRVTSRTIGNLMPRCAPNGELGQTVMTPFRDETNDRWRASPAARQAYATRYRHDRERSVGPVVHRVPHTSVKRRS